MLLAVAQNQYFLVCCDAQSAAARGLLWVKMRHAGRRRARKQYLQNRTPWPVSADLLALRDGFTQNQP
jgi:hypothetical protein